MSVKPEPITNGKLVLLTNELLSPLLKEHQETLEKSLEVDYDLDLSKEFRWKNYPVILLILKHSLKEFVSTLPPNPEQEYNKTNQKGFLYLYDGRVPNYMSDGISWKKQRMSVKLIVHNAAKGIYKIKNHKTDEGYAVMRRQTWQHPNGWRKNEYKLINRETYYKPETDGTLSVNECQTLQNFPVLVHYFKKNNSSSSTKHNRDDDDEDDDFEEETTKPKKATTAVAKKAKVVGIKQEITTATAITSSSSSSSSMIPSQHQIQVTATTADDVMTGQFPLSPTAVLASIANEDYPLFTSDMMNMNIQKLVESKRATTIVPVAAPTSPTIEIQSYAPDTGYCNENTKVILVIKGVPPKDCTYSCMIGGTEVPANQIAGGVLEFETLPHTPGVIYFWVVRREIGSKAVQYSKAIPFYFTSADEAGRLSLAFSNLSNDANSREIISKFRHTAKELDLSNNSLIDVDFLSGFYQLHTLILDNNQISSTSNFPRLPKLTALYVNCNLVTVLEPFIEKIKNFFPSLQYLSLLGNEACPAFTKGPHHYYNYRIYVISRLRKLTQLDSSPVTPEEYRHAQSLIPAEEND